MENAFVVTAYVIVIIFGLVPIIKEKHKGEIIVYSFLLILSAGLLIFKMFISPDSKSISEVITNFITGIKQ